LSASATPSISPSSRSVTSTAIDAFSRAQTVPPCAASAATNTWNPARLSTRAAVSRIVASSSTSNTAPEG
jgi:hypothetical protein